MKFEIKRIQNGIHLISSGGEYCYQEIYDSEHDAFADFLRELCDQFGPTDGRYGEKRIYITVKHGDKYECPDAPCEYCTDDFIPQHLRIW